MATAVQTNTAIGSSEKKLSASDIRAGQSNTKIRTAGADCHLVLHSLAGLAGKPALAPGRRTVLETGWEREALLLMPRDRVFSPYIPPFEQCTVMFKLADFLL